MADVGRGLPLLSGPPPPNDSPNAEIACRKCSKEFNVLFARARKCSHCGYQYCHSCSDYQALMPRSGPERGYEAMNVCAFCIELLNITAAGRHQMKTMSLAKLKKYTTAYNIKIDRAVEKDDLIDAIIASKGPNGCLSRTNENYYRKYSVPNRTPPAPNRPRGFFSSRHQGSGSSNPPPPPPPLVPPRPPAVPEFARPDLAPDEPPPPVPPQTGPTFQSSRPDYYSERPQHSNSYPQSPPRPPQQQQEQQQQQYNPPPNPPPRPHSAYDNARHSQGYGGYPGQAYHQPYPQWAQAPPPPPAPPQSSRPQQQQRPSVPPRPTTRPQQQQRPSVPPRPTTQRPPTQASQSQSQSQPQPPPRQRAASGAPPPNLDALVTMSQSEIGSLSIGALKSVLFTNHVNAGQILEKSDLVRKVLTLVEDEKADRERQRQAEEREEMERVQRVLERERERERERDAAGHEDREGGAGSGEQDGDGHDASLPSSSSSVDNRAVDREGGNAGGTGTPSSPPRPAPVSAPKPTSTATHERTSLCVICQDEEANIAIVDCGHMAMCRGCSDLVMSSSRECPLCRTRIVTEARLLRIFKT